MKRYIKSSSYLPDYEQLKSVLNAMKYLLDKVESLGDEAYLTFKDCVGYDFHPDLSDGVIDLSNLLNGTGIDE